MIWRNVFSTTTLIIIRKSQIDITNIIITIYRELTGLSSQTNMTDKKTFQSCVHIKPVILTTIKYKNKEI